MQVLRFSANGGTKTFKILSLLQELLSVLGSSLYKPGWWIEQCLPYWHWGEQ